MAGVLDGRSLAQRVAEAKGFLQGQGYLVRGPLITKQEVQTPAQLARFFYDTMALYNPQFKSVYAGNMPKDRAIAKRLIESRMGLGSDRERAVAECCEFIVLLFKYERHLRLSFQVTSMSVLGLESMAWVTERLWQMYEGLHSAVNWEEDARWFETMYREQEETIDEAVLADARTRMDKVLKRYGKKEED